MTSIDVVICTYNNAASLAQTLRSLAGQSGRDGLEWRVLVVDNASSDGTPEVVRRAGFRRVCENRQGLVHARRRGVLETDAPWIVFVDDDCILEENWLANAAGFIEAHPNCGAFGGKVVPVWSDSPPGFVFRYLYSFAEQDHGECARTIGWLVGAGLVLNREALRRSGWIDRQYLGDRTGAQLLSGGDMEIVLRIRGAGYQLWYEPRCLLRHMIAPGRTRLEYLVNINYGLGISQVMCDLMQFSRPYCSWLPAALSEILRSYLRAALHTARFALRKSEWGDIRLTLGFARGRLTGLGRVLRMDPDDRRSLLGCACHANRTASLG